MPARRPLIALLLLWQAGSSQGEGPLIPPPDELVFQHAGNMGYLAAGAGWRAGERAALQLLAGYAPASLEGRKIYVAGAKAHYRFDQLADTEKLSLRPYGGLAFHYYFGKRYTTYDYPRGYYNHPSNEWHFSPYLGMRMTSKEMGTKGISLYSEIGIIDAYLIHYYNNYQTLSLEEAVNVSIGVTVPLDEK
jgi:hypothetical protein